MKIASLKEVIYVKVEYEATADILKRITEFDKEIADGVKELGGMLK